MTKNTSEKEKCPLCGSILEDVEECYYCDYRRREYVNTKEDIEDGVFYETLKRRG